MDKCEFCNRNDCPQFNDEPPYVCLSEPGAVAALAAEHDPYGLDEKLQREAWRESSQAFHNEMRKHLHDAEAYSLVGNTATLINECGVELHGWTIVEMGGGSWIRVQRGQEKRWVTRANLRLQ